MAASTLTHESPVLSASDWECAEAYYEAEIFPTVDKPENLGLHLTMDVDTREYWIERSKFGIEEAMRIRRERPSARLAGFRIGYDAAYGYISPIKS
jgi:hypothetical protein